MIFVTSSGRLNCFTSSFLNTAKKSANISSVKTDNVVFRNKSILSELSLHIAITFPNILNFPPIISEILSFANYCSCAESTIVPFEPDNIKSIVPLCFSSAENSLICLII